MERRNKQNRAKSNFTISIIIFLIALFVLLAGLLALRQVKAGMAQQELHLLTISTANKITKEVTDRIWKAGTLATLIVQGNGTIDDFEKIAAILVNDPTILNVSIAPDGVVQNIFPLHKNEAVLGLDYFNSGGAAEAKWARDTGKLTLAGPFTMVQGGQTLTGRLPVYLSDGSFWGFVGIALAYPGVLDAAYLTELFQDKFYGEIWRYDPSDNKKQVIWQSANHDKANPNEAMLESRELELFNVTWHITVSRRPGKFSMIEYWLLLAGVLFLSLLVAMLFYHYLELRHMKTVMENMAMTDPLTKLPNRRNIMNQITNAIEESSQNKQPLVIVYMDLNGFKQVNDLRGHDIGDMVLRRASSLLTNVIGGKGVVARIGGDEFIVLLKRHTRSEELDELVNALDRSVQIILPAEPGKREIKVTGSFGVAYYPDDGTDLKTLLHAADLRMYNTKKIKKDTAVLEGFKNHFR